jgi:uncharacterized membrane protein
MQLKHYQQASVMWMRRVEEIVDAGTGWSISYLAPLTSVRLTDCVFCVCSLEVYRSRSLLVIELNKFCVLMWL